MALTRAKCREYSCTNDYYFMQNESGWTVCAVNDADKTVTPIHGYYFPNIEAPRIEYIARQLGYENTDPYYRALNKSIRKSKENK